MTTPLTVFIWVGAAAWKADTHQRMTNTSLKTAIETAGVATGQHLPHINTGEG
jgi:hypothetical protein